MHVIAYICYDAGGMNSQPTLTNRYPCTTEWLYSTTSWIRDHDSQDWCLVHAGGINVILGWLCSFAWMQYRPTSLQIIIRSCNAMIPPITIHAIRAATTLRYTYLHLLCTSYNMHTHITYIALTCFVPSSFERLTTCWVLTVCSSRVPPCDPDTMMWSLALRATQVTGAVWPYKKGGNRYGMNKHESTNITTCTSTCISNIHSTQHTIFEVCPCWHSA